MNINDHRREKVINAFNEMIGKKISGIALTNGHVYIYFDDKISYEFFSPSKDLVCTKGLCDRTLKDDVGIQKDSLTCVTTENLE